MQDTELYQQILGLQSPWAVYRVELNMELGKVVVHVSHPTGTKFCCPECSRELGCYDHAPSRQWRHLDRKVIHTKLEPLKTVARTIRDRLDNVVSYCTFNGLSNGVAEGINSKIQSIKRRVGGYRNKQNYKTAIFFYCGGLQLDP